MGQRGFSSQAGFSLMQVLVAMGMASVLIMSLMSSVTLLGKAKRSVELSGDTNEFIMNLRQQIASSDQCSPALKDKVLNLSGNPQPLSEIKLSNRLYKVGEPISNGLNLKSLSLISNSQVPAVNVPMELNGVMVTRVRRVAILKVETEKIKDMGISQAPFFIPLTVLTDNNSPAVIQSCLDAGVKSAKACADIGYKWDAANSQCLPVNRCLYAGSFNQGTGGFVNPLTNAYSCPTGYSAQKAGAIVEARSCGKKCVTNISTTTYECVRCVDANGTPQSMANIPLNQLDTSTIDYSQELEEAETDWEAQALKLQQQVDATIAASGFSCLPASYVVLNNPCSGAPVVEDFKACCSQKAQVCKKTFTVEGEQYSIPEYIRCQ